MILVDIFCIWTILLNGNLLKRSLTCLEKRGAEDFHAFVIDEVVCQIEAVQVLVEEADCSAFERIDGLAKLDYTMVLDSGEVERQSANLCFVFGSDLDDGSDLSTRECICSAKDEDIVDGESCIWINKLLLVQHTILFDEHLIDEVIFPDEPMQSRKKDFHSLMLLVEAWLKVLDEVFLCVRHEQAVEIFIHQLMQCRDTLSLEKVIGLAP